MALPLIKGEYMKLELTKEKVAIIGCATCKNMAPFGDDSWEFWGVNNLFLSMPDVKWSKWFEIHPIRKQGNQWQRRWNNIFRGQDMNAYIADLNKLPCPIIMEKVWPDVPNSVAYPKAEILSKMGNYFTNTISYQIALAILLGAKEIGIWGVDMAVDTEYHHQRPSCEYFVGLARGMGIKVTIPDESDLCKTQFLYAFEEKEMDKWEKKTNSIRQSLAAQRVKHENLMRQSEIKLHQAIGADQAMMEMQKIWKSM